MPKPWMFAFAVLAVVVSFAALAPALVPAHAAAQATSGQAAAAPAGAAQTAAAPATSAQAASAQAASAQDAGAQAAAAPDAAVSASASMKAELLQYVADAESKLNQLAEAMPANKYSWRPGKGVRSVGEVFMHVAGANLGVPAFWGASTPPGFNPMTYEKSLTGKADVQKALRESFVSLEANIGALSDADFDKPVTLFGNQTTARGACFLLLSHAHEHLGQSIAYARMNGVTPPWSIKQPAKEKPAH